MYIWNFMKNLNVINICSLVLLFLVFFFLYKGPEVVIASAVDIIKCFFPLNGWGSSLKENLKKVFESGFEEVESQAFQELRFEDLVPCVGNLSC